MSTNNDEVLEKMKYYVPIFISLYKRY